MRHIFILFMLLLIVLGSSGQPKKRDKVKRKYRKVEQVNKILPGGVFHGRVRDINRKSLAGACVEVEDLKRRVHTNAEGWFLLKNLPPGRLRIKISYIGYRTKYFDYYVQAGQNTHYIALDQDDIHMEPLTAIAQKREQHIPDVPMSLSLVSDLFAEQAGVIDFEGLADLIPGLYYEYNGAGNSAFNIRGSTGNFGFPCFAPQVAVLFDRVPLVPGHGYSGELFDIEHVEVLKGSQNSLSGRNAYNGAVHFISKKPGKNLGGYLTSGGGNFGNKELQGAVDLPVAEDILYIRTAGFYHKRNGYVTNNAGVNFNGKNSHGGRLSVSLLPAYNHQVNLQVNYQKFDEPGKAFMNKWYPPEEEDNSLFSYSSIINTGELSGYEMKLMDVTLNYRLFRSENDYWTFISSYRKTDASSAWDADGTELPGLYMDKNANAKLFFQEIRYNFSRISRTNGSIGIDYSYGCLGGTQGLLSNDQSVVDILLFPGNFILPRESSLSVFPQPLNPDPFTGTDMSGTHSEELFRKKSGWSAQAFIDFTHRLTKKIFFTGGARVVYDHFKLTGESVFVDGRQSALGGLLGTSPNLFYSPFGTHTINNSLSFTGRAGFTYRFNENANFYFQASRGRRPEVLQFSMTGFSRVSDPEKVNNLEGGAKFSFFRRIYIEANGYYRQHKNVQTILWKMDPDEGLIGSNGKAVSYGADAGLRVALAKGVDLFGNYAWMVSSFDSTDVNGLDYIYAGNNFALAPEHSFTVGGSLSVNILPAIRFFLVPWYSWKSHFWFTEANVAGLEQFVYGILNINTGLELAKPNVILSIYGTNLLEQNYIVSAGHYGGLLGLPTFVPGPPAMFGARLTWKF
jgi:iron complex outermembrane recepter protein